MSEVPAQWPLRPLLADRLEMAAELGHPLTDSRDQGDNVAYARVAIRATHQVSRAGRPASPKMAHGFERFQEALPGLGPLRSTTVAQSIAHGQVAALDSFWIDARDSLQPPWRSR